MRKAQMFAKKMTELELTNNNLKPHLEEMPFLQGISTQMEAVLAEARSLDGEQEVARGRLQDLVHRRQELEKRGETLRRRAASHLKGSFGFSSDELVKFGVRPRPAGPRGPRKAKPAAKTPPAAAATPDASNP